MKNFNNIIYILLAVLMISTTSCEDKLDIGPEDSLTTDVVLSNALLAEGVLIGAYARMRDDDTFNGTTQLTQEWMSDNVEFKGSFPTFQEIRDYITLANNTSVFPYWRDSYDVISVCNFLITNLPITDISDLSDVEKARLIAEAKFIRALNNFNLVNLFAQPFQFSSGSNLGIPIVTAFFEGDPSVFQVERNTVNEVHAAIEQDLLDAIPDLLEVTSTGKASKNGAKALLSRLYLYREQWADAADYANQVIESGTNLLATDYTFYDDDNSSEHIFQIINNAVDGQTSGQGYSGLANAAPVGRGDAPFTQNLIDAFEEEAGDLRFDLKADGTDGLNGISTFTTKFPEGATNSDNGPVLRITEVYLIRAEANLRGGSSVGDTPLNDINELRDRAGLADLGAVDLDIILNEKRKELCFEGQRRMDLLRNGMGLRRAGMPLTTEAAFGADKTILPIPTAERDLNNNITQNPGY